MEGQEKTQRHSLTDKCKERKNSYWNKQEETVKLAQQLRKIGMCCEKQIRRKGRSSQSRRKEGMKEARTEGKK